MVRFCPFCGGENAVDATRCASCARQLPRQAPKKPPTQPLSGPSTPPVSALLPLPPPEGKTPLPQLIRIPPPVPPPPPPRPALDEDAPTTIDLPPALSPSARTLARTPTPGGVMPDNARVETAAHLADMARALPVMPPVPDGAPHHLAIYAVKVVAARHRRKTVMKLLTTDVARDTGSLEIVFAELGKIARKVKLESKALVEENGYIDEAERRRGIAEQACAALTGKKTEENARFEKAERDVAGRLGDRESVLGELAAELDRLDAERKSLRDRKRAVERKQRAILDGVKGLGEDSLAEARRAADHLGTDKAELDRALAGTEVPFNDLMARVRDAKADVDVRKRELANAREGHRQRLAELEAESAGKFRELQSAENEIGRRLVTLGTILNLNRIEHPELGSTYARGDSLRGQIHLRQTEIERLGAERDAYDRASALRGGLILALASLALLSAILVIVKYVLK
jgi:hypothetical protein